jgi:hypothetical protein
MKWPLLYVVLSIILIHPLVFSSSKPSQSKVSKSKMVQNKVLSGKRVPSNCSEVCASKNAAIEKIRGLIEEYKGVMPNPLNHETFDQQTKIVKLTINEVSEFVQNNKRLLEDPNRSEESFKALAEIWLTAIKYDFTHSIAIQNAEVLKPHFKNFQRHIKGQQIKLDQERETKGLKEQKRLLTNLRLALAIAATDYL